MAEEDKKSAEEKPVEQEKPVEKPKEPETQADKPVDFSEAGELDPNKTEIKPEPTPATTTDMSKEAQAISNTTMADEPAPAGEKSATSTQAEDFGVAPASSQTTQMPAAQQSSGSNTVPQEIIGWNWGAFFFTWLWGVCNGVWISLLALLGPLSLIMAIILGIKGNEWAWQNRKFASVEDFKKTQRTWAIWGLVLFLIGIAISVIVIIASIYAAQNGAVTTNTSFEY